MKKLLLLGTLMIAALTGANAQITYHDIDPDTTVNTWDAFSILLSGSSNSVTLWWHPTPEVVVETYGDCEILFGAASLPAKLNAGDSIAPSATWNTGGYDALSSSGTGNWRTSADDKYLGFRFKNGGTDWYYGWLKMSVGAGASSFTVEEWAYNAQPNKSIKAGQMAATTGIVPAVYSDNIDIINNGRQVSFTNMPAATQYNVAIAGIDGRMIKKTTVAAKDVIDISGLAAGTYIVQLIGGGGTHNFKIEVR